MLAFCLFFGFTTMISLKYRLFFFLAVSCIRAPVNKDFDSLSPPMFVTKFWDKYISLLKLHKFCWKVKKLKRNSYMLSEISLVLKILNKGDKDKKFLTFQESVYFKIIMFFCIIKIPN